MNTRYRSFADGTFILPQSSSLALLQPLPSNPIKLLSGCMAATSGSAGVSSSPCKSLTLKVVPGEGGDCCSCRRAIAQAGPLNSTGCSSPTRTESVSQIPCGIQKKKKSTGGDGERIRIMWCVVPCIFWGFLFVCPPSVFHFLIATSWFVFVVPLSPMFAALGCYRKFRCLVGRQQASQTCHPDGQLVITAFYIHRRLGIWPRGAQSIVHTHGSVFSRRNNKIRLGDSSTMFPPRPVPFRRYCRRLSDPEHWARRWQHRQDWQTD